MGYALRMSQATTQNPSAAPVSDARNKRKRTGSPVRVVTIESGDSMPDTDSILADYGSRKDQLSFESTPLSRRAVEVRQNPSLFTNDQQRIKRLTGERRRNMSIDGHTQSPLTCRSTAVQLESDAQSLTTVLNDGSAAQPGVATVSQCSSKLAALAFSQPAHPTTSDPDSDSAASHFAPASTSSSLTVHAAARTRSPPVTSPVTVASNTTAIAGVPRARARTVLGSDTDTCTGMGTVTDGIIPPSQPKQPRQRDRQQRPADECDDLMLRKLVGKEGLIEQFSQLSADAVAAHPIEYRNLARKVESLEQTNWTNAADSLARMHKTIKDGCRYLRRITDKPEQDL